MTVEVKSEWIRVQDVTTPTIAELNATLETTGPGTPRLPYATVESDTVTVAKITIAPLALVNPLLRSPLLTPINTCNLISARAVYLGLKSRVTPLLHCIQD